MSKDLEYFGKGANMETGKKRWEFRTLIPVVACYALWLAATAGFLGTVEAYGFVAGCLLLFLVAAVSAAFHTSLQHEVVHDHPTPYGALNEALIFAPLILVYPFRRYRDLHLKHHIDENLTDPYADPESYYWPLCDHRTMSWLLKILLSANNTFVGRMVLGPPLGLTGFYRTELQRLGGNEEGVRLAWVLHLIGILPVYYWISYVCGIPIWLYLFVVAYPAVSWIMVRSFAEHQAASSVGGRTAIVEAGRFFSLLFLNNNLHLVHHAHPQVSWYELPKIYRERKDIYLAANGGFFFDGYWQVIKKYGFRPKQPVFHPILHREEEFHSRKTDRR